MDLDIFSSMENYHLEWMQLGKLTLAFILSSMIGLEREIKLKAAGLRTHTLVGLGAALMMLVSKYGFMDIINLESISLDPSRVAAQIVSGIGFIGAGLIFVRKDNVHGLTTAATIWVTAGIGMACGGGLPILAVMATIGHFIVVSGYSRLMRLAMGTSRSFSVRYTIGHDVASQVLELCSQADFAIRSFSMKTNAAGENNVGTMQVRVIGSKSITALVQKITSLPDVVSVNVSNPRDEE